MYVISSLTFMYSFVCYFVFISFASIISWRKRSAFPPEKPILYQIIPEVPVPQIIIVLLLQHLSFVKVVDFDIPL